MHVRSIPRRKEINGRISRRQLLTRAHHFILLPNLIQKYSFITVREALSSSSYHNLHPIFTDLTPLSSYVLG